MISNFENFNPSAGGPNYKSCHQGGYIALISLLVIAATGLTIGIALSLAGIEEVQSSFAVSQAARAKSAADSCIEDGLERLRINWSSHAGTLAIGSDLCIIDILVSGSNATLTATGTVDIFKQRIQIQVDDSLNVTSWQE